MVPKEAYGLVEGAHELWTACAEILREQVSEAVWLTTFNAAKPLELADGQLRLAVPSSVVRDRIEGRYLTLVRSALADVGGGAIELRIEVHTEGDQAATRDEFTAPAHGDRQDIHNPVDSGRHPVGTPDDTGTRRGREPDFVNPRYTFEAFVIGTSNRFAHAAALSVAETPARSYNPLFIYGDAGLGKTHLLQAIAHYVNENYPTFVVRYVTTETFLNQFVDAIRAGAMADFKKRYREVDVLLLDDIQFIEKSEQLQDEFFHTFNALYQANRQIVLSSDRPPDAMATLEERLRSRFKMGLTTEINPPELETRLAILRKKAENEPVPPPPEVLEFIASNITNNIRELEGALIRVCAYASLTDEKLSVDLAERVLSDLITDSGPKPITPELIMRKTCEMFGYSEEEIRGKSRRRPLVTARQIGMYVFREMTDLSYPAIAREFGGRDHTTVIHAVEKVGALMKERRQVYDQVTALTQAVRSGS
ncbi:chromosomal replication initiator protein DnaA [Rhabdothermincola sp.]|uniref:chromosomal replication initiator protein DnaA n=1 Tax=Rhabdothermincola sp. TaxID=2820405 RepID=UPI002FE310A9